jgi:hypothetical protein
VLAQELDAHEDVQAAFIAFAERRFERCRMVVEGSARLGELENIGTEESKREHMQVTRYVTEALAAAI